MDGQRDLERAGLRRPGHGAAASHSERLPTEAMLALQSGRKLEAIRITREQTGMGLAEAKDAVDRAGREQDSGPSMARRASQEDSGVLRLVL